MECHFIFELPCDHSKRHAEEGEAAQRFEAERVQLQILEGVKVEQDAMNQLQMQYNPFHLPVKSLLVLKLKASDT